VCTLLTPAAANIGVWAVVVMRVLEGWVDLISTDGSQHYLLHL
jgi:hypothetical protein